MSTRELIDAIRAGDSVAVQAAFEDAMASRIVERLDAMRQDVAKNMFSEAAGAAAKVGANHIHVQQVKHEGQTKYKVHAVGKNFAHGIDVGEHLSDTDLDDFQEMGGKIKHVKPTNEEVELDEADQKVHPNAIHVQHVGGGKYKVHAVGKNWGGDEDGGGIKAGEHLTDSELDDFQEMGGKIKHIKPVREGLFDTFKKSFTSGMQKKLKDRIKPEHHNKYDIDSVKSVGDMATVLDQAHKAGHLKPKDGVKLAEGLIDEEQLDELSLKTLQRYDFKASQQAMKADNKKFFAKGEPGREQEVADAQKVLDKRRAGLARARPKQDAKAQALNAALKKEDLDLDEGLADDFLAHVQKTRPGAKLAGSVADQKKERDAMMAKREKERAGQPKPAPQPSKEKYPLGGYDPKSGRSYSD